MRSVRSSCRPRWCCASGWMAFPKSPRRPAPWRTRPGATSGTRSTATSVCCTFPSTTARCRALQCERLTAAYRAACRRPTRVIVLAGGHDFWSNGIHLNVIEASAQPAEESRAQHRCDRRSRAGDPRDPIAPDARGAAGQRGRWRRLSCACRRPCRRARRHRAESALQGHGEPLRLGVLDLSAAAAPRRGRRARIDRRSAADGCLDGAAAWPRRRLLRHNAAEPS